MIKIHDAREAVEQMADALSALPSKQWAEWMDYLLEILEAECQADCDVEGALIEIKAGIERRLERQRW